MTRARAGLLLLVVLHLGGCAYYNGMYNAKRLAGRARKAEQEGRTFEAGSYWGQVITKTDSVLARHPHSRWADEARLLHGTGLARLNDCERALPSLEAVMVGAHDQALAEEAALIVGRCRLKIGDPVSATSAFARLTSSSDPARRNLALWEHGRALRINGDYEAAIGELAASEDPRVAGELAAALAGMGRVPEALRITEPLLQAADTAAPWDSLLAALRRHEPAAASDLTTRIASTPSMPAELRARLLLHDAQGMPETDSLSVDRRLFEAESLGAGTEVEPEAAFTRLKLSVARAAGSVDLQTQADRLGVFAEGGGKVGPRALQLAASVRRAVTLADSVEPGAPRGDLRLFVAGEVARDSAGAFRFAAGQFRRVALEWPESPFTPKAIFALIELDPAAGDSLRAVLAGSYASNPYVTFVSAGDGGSLPVLEDSLRRFTATLRGTGRPPTRQPARPTNRPQPPPTPREPVNR